jgi:sulfatase maturation enzyme AslB (radical SAM superfamily)
MVAPLPKRTFCSIDATAKCNLRCKHCYHFAHEQSREPELTVDEWIARIEEMQRDKPFFSCTWVGGEPLLRKELVERGKKYFRSNRVVTNGTLELPDWSDVEFHISIDGTEKMHDAIRGEGCYARIKANLEKADRKGLKVAVACCLNRENVGCIENLIEEWRGVPAVRHILFDFFTPMRGEANEGLWLSFEERDAVLANLKRLKKKYGEFIGAPPATFDLMRSDKAYKSVGKNCVCVRNGIALDAWGKPKTPCVMGPKADCVRCGCIVPFSVRAWKKPSNLLREIVRSFNKRKA